MATTVAETAVIETAAERPVYVSVSILAERVSAKWADHIGRVVLGAGDATIHLSPDQAYELGVDLVDAALKADESHG